MNIRQINLVREIVDYYETGIQYWHESKEIEKDGYDKVNYVRGLLDDLENEISTERQLKLKKEIIDCEYQIKKCEHILDNLNFYECDGCSEMNIMGDLEHDIKIKQDEINDIQFKKATKLYKLDTKNLITEEEANKFFEKEEGRQIAEENKFFEKEEAKELKKESVN
jgi:hypothetical protein|tara:strand:+ start:162 stop:662 length:501 start_codon:yes stop_codon:yes gene_type:complete